MLGNTSNTVVICMSDDSKRKDITIRGINSDLYDKAAEVARRTGKTIGDIVNESLKLFLDLTEGLRTNLQPIVSGAKEASRMIEAGISTLAPVMITGLDELEVSKEDLEQFGKRVIFSDIDKLYFTDDVDSETLEKYVAMIRNCEEVRVPKNISKLLVLSRCRDVGKLVKE